MGYVKRVIDIIKYQKCIWLIRNEPKSLLETTVLDCYMLREYGYLSSLVRANRL